MKSNYIVRLCTTTNTYYGGYVTLVGALRDIPTNTLSEFRIYKRDGDKEILVAIICNEGIKETV